MPKKLPSISRPLLIGLILLPLLGLSLVLVSVVQVVSTAEKVVSDVRVLATQSNSKLQQTTQSQNQYIATLEDKIFQLESEDTRVKSNQVESESRTIRLLVSQAATLYEQIRDLNDSGTNTKKLDALLATWLRRLPDGEYAEAEQTLASISAQIAQQKAVSIAQPVPGAESAPSSNTPPAAGYSRQKVTVNGTEYVVSLVAADLNSTKVVVDTASGGDCGNDCPVLPVGTYVSRNGGFAGINGSYFCPASYPSCADKKNSFDTLLMNKDKVYFNSENNVYSTVPAVIFTGSGVRFVGASQEWGRDTGVDGVLANYPLLVSGGQAVAGSSSDVKLTAAGNRSFVANKGSTVYIGVVHGVSVAGASQVLAALGMDGALNLDSGGSTALFAGGKYVAGPGRDVPNAIVFVNR